MHVDKSFKKIQAGVRPPPHPGNACILGKNGPETPPLHRDIQTVSYRPSSLSCSIKVKLVHRYIVLTRSPPLSAPLTNPLSNIYSDGSASTLHYPDCDKFAIFTTYIQCSHFLCDDLAYIVFELHCQCQLEGVGWV